MDEFLKNIDLATISNQTLAFIGDSVYDLYIRTYISSKHNFPTGKLHKEAILYVSARAQSHIIDRLMETLTEQEQEVYKRGRNTNINTVSKNVDVISYKKATGFEALIGYLYITKKMERVEEIIHLSIQIVEGK